MRLWSFDRWTADTPIVKHARAAVRNGFAVVFLRPGGKEPLCPLTARERKKAGPHHACGVAHASTDERWVVRKAKYMEDSYGRVNLGVAAYASGVVVIDADTPEQVAAVGELLRELGEDAAVLAGQPTVKTPGSFRDGVWVHAQGTHWYFNRPDDLDLPEWPGEMALRGGAVLRWGNSYTLVPPSVRDEGDYISLAEYIDDVPLGLAALIREHVAKKLDATADLINRYHDDAIVKWSLSTAWHTLLEPEGWAFTGKLDRQCGCPVWRRPGEDLSTDRSAIAHENECTRLQNIEGHGPLYIFSDNPPGLLAEYVARGQRTFTKLQFVAITQFDGDETAAKVALGLEPDYGEMWAGSGQVSDAGTPSTSPELSVDTNPPVPEEQPQVTAPSTAERALVIARELAERDKLDLGALIQEMGRLLNQRTAAEGVDLLLGGGGTSTLGWLPAAGTELAELYDAEDIDVDRDEGVLRRVDGASLFPLGELHIMFGQSECGKSWIALETIRQVCERGGSALYIDLEDTFANFRNRLRKDMHVLEAGKWLREGRLGYVNPNEAPSSAAFTHLRGRFDLIVVDSLSEVVAAIRDGSLRDGTLMRRVLRLFRGLADAGAAVVVIHHGSEKVEAPETGLGASEIRQAVTGQEVAVVNIQPLSRGGGGRSLVYISKDRKGLTNEDVDVRTDGPRAHRRLWAELHMAQVDVVSDTFNYTVTRVTLHEAKHPTKAIDEADQTPKIEQAERAIIVHLGSCHDEQDTAASIIDEVSDEVSDCSPRTVRRALTRLAKDGLVHDTGTTITGPLGGQPSPVIKLGPSPTKEGET